MSIFDRARDILTGDKMPPAIVRGIARLAVLLIRCGMRFDEFRQVHRGQRAKAPSKTLYLIDGYHGGVIFWDWLGIRGGGLWRIYNWPLCVRPQVRRAIKDKRFRVVFDFDAYTFEWMRKNDPKASKLIRRAVDTGRLELVNGTYAQPFSRAESGESFLRQLEYGKKAAMEVSGAEILTFYSQEPAYFPQLPQLLKKFGYKLVVFRTQWAPFGTDPGCDADVISWRSPDGSFLPTIPRYKFQGYERQRKEHPGLAAASLSMGDIPDWTPESLAPFEGEARGRKISYPIVTDLKDTNIPDAPMSRAVETAMMENVQFTTFCEYAESLPESSETVFYGLDDIPCTLPWGLEGDQVPRAINVAESALYVGERLDAAAMIVCGENQEEKLHEAWKSLCLAQHHDLYVCGPWRSRAHDGPMSRVAVEYAKAARDIAEVVAHQAISKLSAEPGGDVILFNPAGHERLDYVEVLVTRDKFPTEQHQSALSDGVLKYPCQVVSEDGDKVRLGAVVRAPSMGIVHLIVVPDREEARKIPPLGNSNKDSFKIDVSKGGKLNIIDDKGAIIAEGPFLTCMRDGASHDSRASIGTVKWISDGAVFRRLEIRGVIADIPFTHTITVYDGIDRIDGRISFDFGGDGAYLGPQMEDDDPEYAFSIQDERKLCLAFKSPLRKLCSSSPFWIGEVAGNRAAGASWVGLEDDRGGGFALINKGTRGYHLDRDEGILRNVLAWGPREWIYASEDSITRGRSRYTALRGEHIYEYSLFPYKSRTDAERAAMEAALPFYTAWRDGARGNLPTPRSALSVEPRSVMVTAFLVRDGAIYTRLWNASDDEVTAKIATAHGGRISSVPLGFDGMGEDLPKSQLKLAPWGVSAVKIDYRK